MKSVKRIICVVLFLLLQQSNYAQLSLPGVFIEMRYPSWDKDSIKQHKIRSIIIKQMNKPSSKAINDNGDRLIYEFDKQGNLTLFMKVYRNHIGLLDTSSTTYSYESGELKIQLEILGSYQRKTEFERIVDHNIKQTISVHRGPTPWQVISVEGVETQLLKTGEVIRIGGINADPYQSIVIERNDKGQMITRDVWNGNRMMLSEKWSYARKGSVHYTKTNAQGTEEVSIILAKETGSWCTDDKCRNWSVVYDKFHKEEGWIFMNSETQDAEIWEFDYAFFDSGSLTEGR